MSAIHLLPSFVNTNLFSANLLSIGSTASRIADFALPYITALGNFLSSSYMQISAYIVANPVMTASIVAAACLALFLIREGKNWYYCNKAAASAGILQDVAPGVRIGERTNPLC